MSEFSNIPPAHPENPERIAHITLDEGRIKSRTPEIEHERAVALTDLLHENQFSPHELRCGPYSLFLSEREGRLVFDVTSQTTEKHEKIALPTQPLRSLIRDYFLICESYFSAIQAGNSAKLEAIDMGRRGVHNEASTLLREMLEEKIEVDFATARRLFTLVCVLHIK